MITLTATQLRQAADIKEKIDALQNQLNKLIGNGAPTPLQATKAPKKRKMSAAGKANIRAGVKARWAKYNAAKAKPAKKAKKKFTAAGRARLAALAKARWAKAKKAGKSRL